MVIKLPAGASGAEINVPIRSMDDFHPDQLYNNVPLFEKLSNLRAKLLDPTSFDKAAAAVRSLACDPELGRASAPQTSLSTNVPRKRIDSFLDLLDAPIAEAKEVDLKTMLRDIVGPHVVPDMQGQKELVQAIDSSLSNLMNQILHHPDFQSLESLWRSLEFLLHRVELDEGVELVLYDLHAGELAADLASHEQLEQSALFQLLVENPTSDANQGAFAVIVGSYVWEFIPPHAELLARIAQIAAASGAPWITSMDRAVLDLPRREEIHPLIIQAWEALRALPAAQYLGLTIPRFMLRWPYGKKTESIDSFAYEEFSTRAGLSSMLWGNGAIAVACSLARSFVQNGLTGMKLTDCLTLEDIPFYYYSDQYGDQVALPCTERLIQEKVAQQVSSQGWIPLVSMKGRSEIRVGGIRAVAGTSLAGPWAPVSIDAMPTSPGVANDNAWQPAAPSEDVSSSSADPGSGGSESNNEPPAAPAEGPVDELDQLLAALDAPPAASETPTTDDGMDPELAALLADL